MRGVDTVLYGFCYRLDEDRLCQALPQRVFLATFVFDGDDTVKSAHLLDTQHTPGDKAALPEMVQDRRTLVADLGDTYHVPNRGLARGFGIS